MDVVITKMKNIIVMTGIVGQILLNQSVTMINIDEILDDMSSYICDDIWSNITKDWIESYLKEQWPDLKYTSEELDTLFSESITMQKQMQEDCKNEEIEKFKADVYDLIDATENLDNTDIIKALVSIAYYSLGQ